MIRVTFRPALLPVVLAFTLHAASALAATRVIVSGHGDDTNPCTFTAPCRTFAHAIGEVDAKGEIVALDSFAFGEVIITKSVTIAAPPGLEAAVQAVAGENTITINAGAGDVVALRGLTLEGLGSGSNGVVFKSGGALEIADCVVRNFTAAGLLFQPGAAATLKVSDSAFNDNGAQGVLIEPIGSAQVTGVVERTGLHNNVIGLAVAADKTSGGTIAVTAKDTTASNNSNSAATDGEGFEVQATSSQAVTHLMLVGSVAANNFQGIFALGGNAGAVVSGATITGNAFGWIVQDSATITSFGNNAVIGNASGEGAMTGATFK